MHIRKHKLLAQQGFAFLSAVHAAAMDAGVSVDDVVMALVGKVAPAAAAPAAEQLQRDFPTVGAALKDWPIDCPFCGNPTDRLHACPGNGCRKSGCRDCVLADGYCPACREDRRLRAEQRSHEQAARAATAEAEAEAKALREAMETVSS